MARGGDEYDRLYERLQEKIDLDEMTDGAIEELLITNFTNRKTEHSGTVDLTSTHDLKEWKDYSGGTLRTKENIPGFTPRLDGAIEKIKTRRNADIDLQLKEVTKPFYRRISSVEAGDFGKLYDELDEREEEIEKWREVRGDKVTDNLIMNHVENYRQEMQMLEEQLELQKKLDLLEEIEEERISRATKAYRASKKRK